MCVNLFGISVSVYILLYGSYLFRDATDQTASITIETLATSLTE